jgi:hypothetical protein
MVATPIQGGKGRKVMVATAQQIKRKKREKRSLLDPRAPLPLDFEGEWLGQVVFHQLGHDLLVLG